MSDGLCNSAAVYHVRRREMPPWQVANRVYRAALHSAQGRHMSSLRSERTGISRTLSLESQGYRFADPRRQYQLNIRLPKRRRYRIGFAGQSKEFAFSRAVAGGVAEAASKAEIDLVV